ncbi:hypothetical protein ASPWEDRAFT_128614 [Aspergillus wentii DTO 134E9]|uniref:Major facilitator superfamily (MFS) profile domain-containing protein n=1 Tax=Aspergillus wentii DTO 134E9 TaxID=1073089 RepID=A0A1L9RWL2_ASPWE|nr:uncharacterized protein ASPWEDRAFT_128614 [Aspergillus wentii DTO 134E9]KAI9928982.1 hypothetical protein MW887_001375 [Aspergillus wentii]OJJ39331.1 hypothetical protein ASPWEDRAFT_128614 [Aspergillus wentii DTO 134E9]
MAFLLVSFCCAFSALGSFLFGYDAGVISTSIDQPSFLHQFGYPSDAATGGIVASYTGGAIVGSIVVSYLSDPFGRRLVMFIGGLLAAFGAALQGGAVTIAMLIAGRFIAGLAIGLMSVTVPVYCSEVAPPRVRGLLTCMQQWMMGIGSMVAQWVGYGCSLHSGDFSWRFPLSLQALPAVILCCGVWFLPESPRWLIEKGHDEAGRATLTRLHLNRDRSNQELIDYEFAQISDSVAYEKRTIVRSWRQLLLNTSWRRRVLLACGMQIFTQTSGTNVIQNYSPRIYQGLGLSHSTSLMITGVWGALAVFWNTFFMLFIDRVGRRKLLIPSLLGMGATMCVEGTLARYYDFSTTPNANALRAAVSMFFVFTFFFTSLGLISWVYPTEIFPTAIRARGSSLSTATNWSINLVFAQCSPIAITRISYRYFYCFVAFNWVASVIVWFFYPETAGNSLEEVERVFAHAVSESELVPGGNSHSYKHTMVYSKTSDGISSNDSADAIKLNPSCVEHR